MDDPIWTYDANLHILVGPDPMPTIPPKICISAQELAAEDKHDVVELDQDVQVAVLGTGYIPSDWHLKSSTCVERPFCMSGWTGAGWNARYRRTSVEDQFTLTHVWAEDWNAVHVTPWR